MLWIFRSGWWCRWRHRDDLHVCIVAGDKWLICDHCRAGINLES